MNPTVIFTVVIASVLLICTILVNPHKELNQDSELYSKQHFIVEFINSTTPTSSGIVIGLLCLFLCWTVNYFNWLHVGDFPSTPLSPQSRTRLLNSQTDIMSTSEFGGSNTELAYFTPILISVAAAGILVWNSLDG